MQLETRLTVKGSMPPHATDRQSSPEKQRPGFRVSTRSDAEAAMSSDVSTGQIETREQEAFMRRLILQTGISIDGYVAALDRSHPCSDGSEDEAVKRWILDSVWAAAPP